MLPNVEKCYNFAGPEWGFMYHFRLFLVFFITKHCTQKQKMLYYNRIKIGVLAPVTECGPRVLGNMKNEAVIPAERKEKCR